MLCSFPQTRLSNNVLETINALIDEYSKTVYGVGNGLHSAPRCGTLKHRRYHSSRVILYHSFDHIILTSYPVF